MSATGRYCSSCGYHLATPGEPCGTCMQRLTGPSGPPDLPPDFWIDPAVQTALAAEHMGAVIRAYRNHRHHGHQRLSQEEVGGWAGLTQAQLSRIETGPPIRDLDRLTSWARLLDIPRQHLWFHSPPDASHDGAVSPLRRSEFLRLMGVTAPVVALSSMSLAGPAAAAAAGVSAESTAQALAWELWQRRRTSVHPEELPAELANMLSAVRAGGGYVVRTHDGSYAMAHAGLVDFFVARAIFDDIATGNSTLFASAQTTRDTDQVLQGFVAQDASLVVKLKTWMHRAANPVLRVNATGVLSKINSPTLTPIVIDTLHSDVDTRHLFLTAVAARVLDIEWNAAAAIASQVNSGRHWDMGVASAQRLADEALKNQGDGAARWLSLVLLGHLEADSRDAVAGTLQQALRAEPDTATVRAIGSVLSGAHPLAV